ncbi:MAG: hypothetical protein IT370_00295 [Deltaproteobacteria bacterium]|nr:hypothetical protein [Deltaproteobacteria bacterium]
MSDAPKKGGKPGASEGQDAELEREADRIIGELSSAFAELGDDARWRVARAVIHRAVHAAARSRQVEFCVMASYLAEMIPHAHGLMHGADPGSPRHKEPLH